MHQIQTNPYYTIQMAVVILPEIPCIHSEYNKSEKTNKHIK